MPADNFLFFFYLQQEKLIFLNETEFITKLERYFRTQNLLKFIELFNNLDESTDIDFGKIPNISQKISTLITTSLEMSVMSSDFYTFFNLLRIGSKYRLLKSSVDKRNVYKEVKGIQISYLYLENLKSLFGNINQDFIDFIVYDLPYLTLNLIQTRMRDFTQAHFEISDLKKYVENVFYAYTLRTRKVATFEEYVKWYHEKKTKYDNNFMVLDVKVDFHGDFLNFEMQFIDCDDLHVIDEDIFLNIVDLHEKEKILYDYPIISLVTSGGVGPQGKGFAYLTPLNEVVEICSDLSQNQAYILKFKEFLKSFFLKHLKKKLQEEITSQDAIESLIAFLEDEIQLELINISHYEIIVEKIEEYVDKKRIALHDKDDFIDYVKQSLLQILAPVKLEDQFKLRMKLIHENKLRVTDVSKLVSLGDVSHYDVLNQREFFIHSLDHLDKIRNLE